jgi:protein O-GlcNAc transferase
MVMRTRTGAGADPLDLALERHRDGDFAGAQAAYDELLRMNPAHPGALMGLGLLAHQRGDFERACSLLEEARRLAPRSPVVLNNLALTWSAQGREGEAQALWCRVLTIDPRFADAHVNLANADARAGRTDSALRRYEAALAIDPRSFSAAANLGALLLARRRYAQARRLLETAQAIAPENADVKVNLGRLFSACGLAKEARQAFEAAAQLQPQDRAAASNLLLALHYCEDVSREEVFAAHVAAGRRLEGDTPQVRPPVAAGRPRRLRVGFLSGDFNDHAVMRFFLPVLTHRDRSRLEVRCYSTAAREDAYTAQVRAQADAFVPVAELAEPETARRLRADDLDVLVDLAGHSAGGRPAVLATRPAPLQVSWIGYLDTTGLAGMDFRITDAVADPPGLTEHLHTERLWRMPSMWCFAPLAAAPEPGPPPAAATGVITFASMNNPAKISDSALALWGDVLAGVPASRLLIHAHDDPLCRDRIRAAIASRGIAADRLQFSPRVPVVDYLKQYQGIDILLDTTPYSGGTITCDALWMGVPAITLAGDRPFSRTSASVLHAAGFPQWSAGTREKFVRIALALAGDVAALGLMRARMRERLAASRLLDARATASDLADALCAMWNAAGLPPRLSA